VLKSDPHVHQPGGASTNGHWTALPNRISPSSKPRQLPDQLTSILQRQHLPPPFVRVKLDILPHRHAPRGPITLLPTSHTLYITVSHCRSLKGDESSRFSKKEPRTLLPDSSEKCQSQNALEPSLTEFRVASRPPTLACHWNALWVSAAFRVCNTKVFL
jgi:hypothetical protein